MLVVLLAFPAFGQVASRDFEADDSDCMTYVTTFDGSDTSYSVVAWINLETLPTNAQPFWVGSSGDSSDIYFSLNIISAGTEARCTVRDDAENTQTVSGSTSVSVDGLWHIFACTRNGNSVTSYYDSSSDNDSAVSIGSMSVNIARIGCRAPLAAESLFFDGELAHLQIFDVELTAEQGFCC